VIDPEEARYRRFVWIGAAVYAVVYFLLDYDRYLTYATTTDFADIFQMVSDPSGLLRNTVEGGSHFGMHFSPIYDLAMPLVALTSSPVPLLVLQAVAGALVAPGLFELGRRLMPPRWAFAVASLAFVYPPLAGVIFGDPYETIFAPALTVWLFVAVVNRRWFISVVLAALTLAIKEDQAVVLIWAALLAFVQGRRTNDVALQRFSAGVAASSALVLAAFLFAIRPAFAADASWFAFDRTFAARAGDASGGLSILGRLGYLAEAFLPLAFVPFAAPAVLLFALVPMAEVLVPRNAWMWTMGQHYAGVWVGYVLIATVYGAASTLRKSPLLGRRLVVAALALCAANLVFASPTHWRVYLHAPSPHYATLDRVVAADLPAGPVGFQDEVYAHAVNRQGSQQGLAQSPPYALVDTRLSWSATGKQMQADVAQRRYGNYAVVWQRDGIILYEKR
jgi:uncharacterized membrane protein